MKFDSEGKTVWYLYLDIYCLDYDGNVFDASLIALISALKNGMRVERERRWD
jgi:exosome complex component RRP43